MPPCRRYWGALLASPRHLSGGACTSLAPWSQLYAVQRPAQMCRRRFLLPRNKAGRLAVHLCAHPGGECRQAGDEAPCDNKVQNAACFLWGALGSGRPVHCGARGACGWVGVWVRVCVGVVCGPFGCGCDVCGVFMCVHRARGAPFEVHRSALSVCTSSQLRTMVLLWLPSPPPRW